MNNLRSKLSNLKNACHMTKFVFTWMMQQKRITII